MNRLSNVVAWGTAAIVVALAVVNWSTLMAPAPLDLLLVLGLSAVLAALFFFAYLFNQIGSMLEARKLLREIQRVQDLADKAEASRIEALHQLIATEFRSVNERLSQLGVQTAPTNGDQGFRPHSLTEIMTGHARA
jgi:Na+-transporting methylmalonyl-CoA/oxaloacetate decarboxylase gamma subunit